VCITERLLNCNIYPWEVQTYYGRYVVAFNSHKKELFALTPDELEQYMPDVALVAKVVAKVTAN
jgi:diadenosine tetraphosphate (Ap4A) HIT family hydrolase